MAIKLPQGFDIRSAEPIDKRIVLTKAEMRAQNDNIMPVAYLCLCSEDKKLYIYDKTATSSSETGKYRLVDEQVFNNERFTDLETEVYGVIIPEVEDLDSKVTGLGEAVEQLDAKVEQLTEEVEGEGGLEPRVRKAEDNITDIEARIKNILDGGTVQSKYNITSVLSNVTASPSNPTTIDYKGTATLQFFAATGYNLPDTITVNDVVVGGTKIACVKVAAQWIKQEGKVYLSDATGAVKISITGKEVV